jgi:glutamate-1-semialdehyde 2,1-aminomutase
LADLAAAWLAHALPARLPAGSTYAAYVEVENRGRTPWLAQPSDGRRVDLIVLWDGVVAATHALGRPEVRSGERVHIPFALVAPAGRGTRRVELDLVQQGVAFFSDRGLPRLGATVQVDGAAPRPGDALAERARRHSPWHYQPSRFIGASRDGTTFPRFVARASGCRLWDVDGREYVDYVMGWGCSLLGYAEPRVQAAVRAMLDTAPLATLTHPFEIDVAEALSGLVPGAEMAMFGKHGSDACTLAARLARAYTGRRTILYSGYHGWQDFWAEQAGFAHTGIPERPQPLIHAFRFNDAADFRAQFERHRGDLAAILLEPSGPASDSTGPLQGADAAFLGLLADAARDAGALLVFDEILTGFRHAGGSVQRATGVVPDLTCLGKALGAGYPLSAVGGRRAIMEAAMGRTHYGPTFRGELYSLAAARAALAIYAAEPVAERVCAHGEALRAAIDAACLELELPAACMGPPFRMALHFSDPDAARQRLQRALFHQEMLKGGVITYDGFMLPSAAHDATALDIAATAARRALQAIAAARRQDTLEALLEIPLG